MRELRLNGRPLRFCRSEEVSRVLRDCECLAELLGAAVPAVVARLGAACAAELDRRAGVWLGRHLGRLRLEAASAVWVSRRPARRAAADRRELLRWLEFARGYARGGVL